MYKIQEKGRPESAVWLVNERTVISNDKEADIRFSGNASGTTNVHILLQENHLYLEDMSANCPILINGQRVTHKVSIQAGDELKIADISFQIIHSKHIQVTGLDDTKPIEKDSKLWQLQVIRGDLRPKTFKLSPQTIIGRDHTADICINNAKLSRQHMKLIVTGGKVLMQDLNSSSGTLINNKRIDHGILDENDEIQLNNIVFKLIAPIGKAPASGDEGVIAISSSPKTEPNQLKIDKGATTSTSSEKIWVTKPTSIGNRADDSIDEILARHLHIKKLTLRWSAASFVLLAIVTTYLLT